MKSSQGISDTECLEEQARDTDLRHIQKSLRGDGNAYGQLVKKYEPAIFRQMAHYSKDQNVIRELVQEVFIEAYRGLGGYRADAPFLHWLRRIASRVGYRYWNLQRRERNRTVPLEEWHKNMAARPPEELEPSEAAEMLYDLLERLPPKDRMVLTLMYFESCDIPMIAERMGWSQTLVRVRLFRARKRLRKLFLEADSGR